MNQIFVYGSLRSGFKHPAYGYLSSFFDFVCMARVKGALYDLGSYPAALPCAEEQWIIGELYTLKEGEDFEWAIEQLDDYEGIHVEENEIPLYRRELTTVFTEKGITEAWIYWFNGDATGKPLIASGDTILYFIEKNKP